MRSQLYQLAAVAVMLLALNAVAAAKKGNNGNGKCKDYEAATLAVISKVIWPTSRDIAVSGVPTPEFASNAQGRVVPAGNFATSLGALEYFYALAGPLDPNDAITNRVTSTNVRWMVCDANKRQVAFENIFLLTSPAIPDAAYNISAMGVFTFNKEGKVCAYDWDLRRLGLVVDTSAQATITRFFAGSVEAYTAATKQQVCGAAMQLCTGPNQQYASFEECIAFLSTIPAGNFDVPDQNNLACRTLHAALVPIRPNVHCSHIGPSGGGKCVAHPVSDLYTQDFSVCLA